MSTGTVKYKWLAVVLSAALILALSGCGGAKNETPVALPEETEQGETMAERNDRRVTIGFQAGEAGIAVPAGWEINDFEASPLPFAGRSYVLEILPPQGEKGAAYITIAKTWGGGLLPKKEFDSFFDYQMYSLLEIAVEKPPVINEANLADGYAVYCTITDASLIGQTPDPDDYLYVTTYMASYNDGCFIHASLFSDDLNSESYSVMFGAVSSIEVNFHEDSDAGTAPRQTAEGNIVFTKHFGTYEVPAGWIEWDKYSEYGKYFYIRSDVDTSGKPKSNVSVEIGKNRYSLGEADLFKDAIRNVLLMQMQGAGGSLSGYGSDTEQGYILFVWEIETGDVTDRQYYIVGDYQFVMVHETDFHDEITEIEEVSRFIADSFVWAEDQ